MNFIQAMHQVDIGKAVRRAASPDSIYFSVHSAQFSDSITCDLHRENFDKGTRADMRTWESSFSRTDIEAKDWEIYERPQT